MAILILLFIATLSVECKILIVGTDPNIFEFTNLTSAAREATAGDTILITSGIYPGGQFISNLKGRVNAYVTIKSAPGHSVIFRGSTEAIHFVDIEYVIIEGLIFEGQTGNGINIDDGGSYDTPSKSIIIRNCHWRGMNATGNNDELKLSGVDDFVIENCVFENGSAGGSLIDMVGCHDGRIIKNTFRNAGSNSLQMKGGSSNIQILQNLFVNGGLRAINIGGSTGLSYFRPNGVNYEAKRIYVGSNIIIGSQAPIAFVGAIECAVTNNTFVNPEKWFLRILQENVEGFLKCGYNVFVNNICYTEADISIAINVGPNTLPETFKFSNNLWYNVRSPNWRPNLPVQEDDGIYGKDPEFAGKPDSNFRLNLISPAIGKGLVDLNLNIPPMYDYDSNRFSNPPSIGAFEFISFSFIDSEVPPKNNLRLLNSNDLEIVLSIESVKCFSVQICNILGEKITSAKVSCYQINEKYVDVLVDISRLTKGIYFIYFGNLNTVLLIK